MDFLTLVAIAAVIVVVLYLAGSRNPIAKCRRCKGRGVLRSSILSWRYRPCPRCGRSGEVRGRFGRKG